MYLERIMLEILNDYNTTISIGVRIMCNMRFANDIDHMAGKEVELAEVNRVKTVSKCMEWKST